MLWPALLARSLQRGEEAKKALESEGLHPEILELDVDSAESIRLARKTVTDKYGRLDVLVNNAGVLYRVRLGRNIQCPYRMNCLNTYRLSHTF